MSAKVILEKLKSGEHEKFDRIVKSHLSKLKKSPKKSDLIEFAHSFITNAWVIIEVAEFEDSVFLIEIIWHCNECFWKDETTKADRSMQEVTRILYLVLKYLLEKNLEINAKIYDVILTTSKHLEKCLDNWNKRNELSTNICYGAFFYLTKTAKECLKRKNVFENDAVCFNLQKLALKFVDREKEPESFSKLCKQARSFAIQYVNAGKTNFPSLFLYFEDTFRQIRQHFDLGEQNLFCLTAVVEFLLEWLPHLLNNAAVCKVDPLRTIEDWEKLSLNLKMQPNLGLLWNFNIDVWKLSAIFSSLKNVNEKSKKIIEDAISRCIDFLRKNKNRDYDEILSKSLLFLWDSLKKNFDILLDETKNNFEFYCHQIGNLLLKFMEWELSNEKSYNGKTLIILKAFFLLLENRSKNLTQIDDCAKIKEDVKVIGKIIYKFGNAFVKFGILKYNEAFSYSVCKIAYTFCNEKLCKYTAAVCSFSHKNMILVSPPNSSSECLVENLWLFTGYYVWSLNILKRHADSLDFIARVLAADYKDQEKAIELWTKTKIGGNLITKISVFDLVSKYISGGNMVDLNSLLMMEAHSNCEYSLKYRVDVSDDIRYIVNQLKSETTKTFDRAVLLITKAKLLGVDSNNLDRKLLNDCDEAKDIFFDSQQNSKLSQASCYLAHSYFYQYVIESRLKFNKFAKKIKMDMAKLQPNNYATIPMSLKCTGSLDLALNIWASVISSNMKLIPCLKNCLKDLLGMASAYSVQRTIKNEFKSLMLALNVAKELNDHVTVGYVSCQIAKIFCNYGFTVQAVEYLLGAKEAIERSNDKVVGTVNLKYLKLFFDVCSSESLLLQNEVIKGWQSLQYVLKEIQDLPKSRTATLLSIEAKLLKSKYLELPFSILPLSERDSTTPLEILNGVYLEDLLIVKCANDYRFADIYSRITNGFFDCTFHLGKMCLGIGDPTMAKPILNWALHWAYKLSLSKRAADILMLNAKINIMSDDFESCQSNLRIVKYIFQSQGESVVDENEFEDEDLDLELIASTNNIDNLDDVNISKDEYNSSPVLENVDMKDHESNCTCALCEQLLFPITCLEFSFLQAQCCYLKDVNRNHAICILRKKRQKFEILSSRIASLILESLSFENTLSGISNSNIYSPFYLLKLDIVNKLINCSLEKSDLDEAHLMAKAAIEEAKTYFWIGLQDLRVAIAHIKYSYCLTKLLKCAKSKKMPVNDIFNKMWSYSTLLSDAGNDFERECDFLESKMSKIRLNDVDLANNFKTPKQTLRPTRVAKCKAPGRNNLRSLRPNQFDDFSDEAFARNFQKLCKSIEEKENEDTVNFSSKKVRRKLVLSSGVLKETKIGKATRERNGEQEECSKLVTSKFVSFLEAVIEQIAHFPVYPLYGDLHLLLSLCKGNLRTDSGIHLFETYGLTLRHRSLLESTSRVQNGDNSNGPSVDKYEETCQYICSFKHLTANLNKDSEKVCINYEKRLHDLNSLLYEGIVVCQINTLPKAFYHHSQHLNSELIITRLQKDREPLVIKVPNDNSRVVNGFLSSFKNIIDDHNNDSKRADRHAWHKFRKEANDKIKLAVTDIENRWLDHWKGLLLGTPAFEEDRRSLRKVVDKLKLEFLKLGFSNFNSYILEMTVDSLPWLSSSQLRQALASLLFLEVADDLLVELCKKVRQYAKPLRSKTVSRNLLILVLDKSINSIPWESIPILQNNTVTRMPSIYSILVHASLNQCPKPIDSSKAFYVVDPESNLPAMAERFDSFVKSLNWSGIFQRRPTNAEWQAAIKDNELFFYSGHGNGRQFYDSKSLSKQVCKAALILSGCSSVKLSAVNHFEANGDVLQYIMAGSPCVVGTLWIVTDLEMDSVVKKLLDMFLPSSEARKTMCEALIAGRAACQYKYITGAATIIYGMPVIAK